MIGKALTRKVAATAIAAFVCGGTAFAAAATLPAGDGSRVHAAADESTTGVDESTTGVDETTTAGDLETTTTGDLETTTTGDLETTTTFDGTSVPCNHGHDVSEVAHNTPPGPGHGAAVSDAAHQKCDKGDHEADDEGDDESGEDESGTHGPPADAGHQGAEHSNGHAHSGDDQGEND
jgi:hypothetical protein